MAPREEQINELDTAVASGEVAHPAIATVRAATQTLADAADERSLIQGICDLVIRRGGYRFVWAGYAGAAPDWTVSPVAHAGHEAGYLKAVRVTVDDGPHGRGPVGTAIRSGRTQVVHSIDENQAFRPWREAALQRGYRSCIALPFGWAGEVYGALAIYSTDPHAFDSEEAALLAELADKLSSGVYFLRLESAHRATETALRNEKEAQEALRRILALSLKPISLDEKLEEVLDILFAIPWFKLERQGSIFLTEPGEQSLRLATRRHLAPVLQDKCAHVAFGHCLCGRAAAEGDTVFESHLNGRHHIRYDGIEDHGHYCQPIRSDGHVLGVINLYLAPGHEESDQEISFLQAVADTLAGLIEREQMDAERQRLATVIEASPDFVGISDIGGTPRYLNRAARRMLGAEGVAPSVCRMASAFPDWACERVNSEGIPAALGKGSWRGETALRTPDGHESPVSHLILAPQEAGEEPTFIATICRDISDRKRAEEAAHALALHEHRVANLVINSLPGVFFLCDRAGNLNRWNANLEAQLGYDGNRLRELNLSDLVDEEGRSTLEEALARIDESGGLSVEFDFVGADGSKAPFFLDMTPVRELEGLDAEVVGVGINIAERKAMEVELERRATRDFLTGVYNRHKFAERLQVEWERADRYDRPLSLVLLDIDHFKHINDAYGHEVGDRALCAVANLLQSRVRTSDVLGRWGGEEFVLLIPETAITEAQALAEKLRDGLAGHCFDGVGRVTASFGVAQRRHGEVMEDLLRRADDALYEAKSGGRNRVCTADG